jgi:GTP 3',8-cyclase
VLIDSYGRVMTDLRVSITDRCNFRCFYCKSSNLANQRERSEILTFEEIVRLSRVFVKLGVRKIRITGGEPMVRRDVDDLIREIAASTELEDLALTTNGFNLAEKAGSLKERGLRRVTISLDSLRRDRFESLTRSKDFYRVLSGIRAAKKVGLQPIKINCVLVRGFNDDEILDFAELALALSISVRFIEFMPLDEPGVWTRDKVVRGDEVLEILSTRYQMIPLGRQNSHATSQDYRFAEGTGEIGLIMPVSRPFCGYCSRVRLTADGKIRTCLFSKTEHDIKALLRDGADDSGLAEFILAVVHQKEKGHRINESGFVPPLRTMSYIGG